MQAMMGIPPATAASNATVRPSARARWKSTSPCSHNRALFAVTTSFPDSSRARKISRAGLTPPISSIATSICAIVDHGLEVVGEQVPGGNGTDRGFLQIADHDFPQLDRPTGPPRDALGLSQQDLRHAGADVSQSEKGHAQWCHRFPFDSGVRLGNCVNSAPVAAVIEVGPMFARVGI